MILKGEVMPFEGKKILSVSGNSKVDQARLQGQKVIAVRSWGKHFLLCFKDFTLKTHFLMFGSYKVNEEKESPIRLRLEFSNGFLNLYSCSVKIIEGDVNDHYDWSGDVMNEEWDPEKAKTKLKKAPAKLVCDALLEQDVFAGVGNIIKNEVLYRVRVHPESKVGKLSAVKLNSIIREARIYSFEFLEWKKQYVLKKHWLAHTKKICLRCDLPIFKKYTGVKERRSFFCKKCQKLYQ